jgi:hypothetical protein
MRRKLYAQEDVCVGTMVLYANGVVYQCPFRLVDRLI